MSSSHQKEGVAVMSGGPAPGHMLDSMVPCRTTTSIRDSLATRTNSEARNLR